MHTSWFQGRWQDGNVPLIVAVVATLLEVALMAVASVSVRVPPVIV